MSDAGKQAEAAADSVLVCAWCGRVNEPQAQFCGTCGRMLAEFAAPGPSRATLNRAEGLASAGEALFAESKQAYLEAARAAPRDVEPLLALARYCRSLGRKREAKRYYREAARRDPDCHAAWLEGADCCGQFHTFRRALWLGHAVRTGQVDYADELFKRFADCYKRLHFWEKWIVRRATGQPA
jgi:tetratricopeptide (TPR) repeat protein